jgi:hypothetical protein
MFIDNGKKIQAKLLFARADFLFDLVEICPGCVLLD